MPPNPRRRPSLNLPSSPAKLYAIVDVDACARAGRLPIDVAWAFLSGGARWIQLRAKTMSSGAFLDLAHRVLQETERAVATLIINDRADIAALSGAPGLHIGQEDLAPGDARAVIGTQTILGLSTHTQEQWERGVNEPISYLAIGPVFGTGTKHTGYQAIGLDTVRRASDAAARKGLPTVAIGGITVDNAASVLEAGAASVAVISDLLNGDPEGRCRAFLGMLE